MLRKKIYTYACLAATALLPTACENFLSELPDKSANQPITTIEQLHGLLNNVPWTEGGATAFSTDDMALPPALYDKYQQLQRNDLYGYTFNTEDIPNETGDGLWQGQYAAIYQANLILEYIDKVSGDAALKARVKAEAHFLRAYSYWVLANYYCLPYAPANMQEQGLPRKLTTGDEEDYTQMTLAQTYALIDADLAEALLIDSEASQNTWRADKATVQAFRSRYCLFRGEYGEAVAAADYALSHAGSAKLKDYNTLTAGTPANFTSPVETIEYCETHTYEDKQLFNWEEFFYVRFSGVDSRLLLPSPELVALYTEMDSDLRYKWFFHPNGNRTLSITGMSVYIYAMFPFGRHFSGITVQEVMLNRAEALLRQPSPDAGKALAMVNELREKRLAPGALNPVLTAGTDAEALTKVLEERRRELPFGFRWWDIRRFAVNETPADDITVTHFFYPVGKGGTPDKQAPPRNYTLPAGSRRYALPINATEIRYSQGKIKQNTY